MDDIQSGAHASVDARELVSDLPGLDDLISLTEALRLARCSTPTLYRMMRVGDFPQGKQVGRTMLLDRRSVERWVEDRKKGKPLLSYAQQEADGHLAKHRGVLTQWLPNEWLIKSPELEAFTKTGRPQIHAWVRKGQFPRPLSPGVWARKHVQDWVNDRKLGKPLPFSHNIPVQWAATSGEKTIRITSPEFRTLTRLLPPQVYRLVSAGDFPEPIARGLYLYGQVMGWVLDRRAGKPMLGSRRVITAWWAEHCARTTLEDRAQRMVPGANVNNPGYRPRESLAERRERLLSPPPGWEDRQRERQLEREQEAERVAAHDPFVPDYNAARERQAAELATAQVWEAPPKPLSELANAWQRETGRPHLRATEPHNQPAEDEDDGPLVADPNEVVNFDEDDLSEFD